MPLLLVHFARFGAYHRARLRTAVEALAPHGWEVRGLEIASTDSTYAWAEVFHSAVAEGGEPLIISAFPGRVYDEITAAEYRSVLHPLLDGVAPDAMAIAGWGSEDGGSCLSWCRRHDVRRIVMSETRHADGRRVWWKEFLKSRIVRRFDAALVGGKSHRDYLVKLGLPADRIRLGYNVVDNGYFAAEAEAWREKTQDDKTQDAREEGEKTEEKKTEDRRPEVRDPYFLASNRFIARKNLARLVDAYAEYVESYQLSVSGHQERKEGAAGQGGDEITQRSGLDGQEASHLHLTPLATSGPAQRSSPTGPWNLVLLGDGELKGALVAQCEALGLRIVEGAPWETGEKVGSDGLGRTPTAPEGEMQLECKCSGDSLASTVTDRRYSASHLPSSASRMPHASCLLPPAVFFPGFRQIDELPRYYAHAGAFVHPAMEEPWGLVINEAMACGLPVLSSRNVGAAEELVDEGVNGWVFDPANVADITACLRKIAEMSDEARLAMSAASARILEERCPTAAFGRGLTELLAR